MSKESNTLDWVYAIFSVLAGLFLLYVNFLGPKTLLAIVIVPMVVLSLAAWAIFSIAMFFRAVGIARINNSKMKLFIYTPLMVVALAGIIYFFPDLFAVLKFIANV